MNIKDFKEEFFYTSRYVALGSLDGILAVMGVTLTASGVAGLSMNVIPNYFIGLTGLSGGIAISLSNAFGSFIAERAEELRNMRELEKKMIIEERKLDDTFIHHQAKRRIFISMVNHGLFTFVGSFIPVLPFFLLENRVNATLTTIILSFLALIFLGLYLGRVSQESLFKTSIEIVVIGIFITILSFFMGGL